jgi:beta-glucanase (GH16 family)
MILLNKLGDEIDFEMTGNPVVPQTNLFYRSVGKSEIEREYFTHYSTVSDERVSGKRVYSIDWKHDSITWTVDGRVVRRQLKEESLSSLNPSGPKWFPDTPSLVQFGVWDAGFTPNPNTTKWVCS